MGRRRDLKAVGWSGAYLLASRLSTLVAIPILLSLLGDDLYAGWVLAGSLLMTQGLVDLGIGAAVVRFVAESLALGSSRGVRAAALRGVLFFAGLGAVVATLLWILAPEIATAAFGPGSDSAAVLMRYAAVSFFLTSLVASTGSILQGLNRVDLSFRSQTFGWLTYIPALLLGSLFLADAHAAGLAWVVTYGVQLVLLGPVALRHVHAVSGEGSSATSLGSMIRFGGWWQVSSWADFATFQLPRVLGAFLVSAPALVSLDLALRFGQAAVLPLFAVYPILLPNFSRIWARTGMAGLRRPLESWYAQVAGTIVITLAVLFPLSVPAIAVWTGRPISDVDVAITCAVLAGIAAHASTGVFTNAWLAAGELRPVVMYKAGQLGIALVCVSAGAVIGATALGIALAVALSVPALLFNRRSATALGVDRPSATSPSVVRVCVFCLSASGLVAAVVYVAAHELSAGGALVVAIAIGAPVWFAGLTLTGLRGRLADAVRRGHEPMRVA